MTSTKRERPTGNPGPAIDTDTTTRPAELTEDQLAITHQTASGTARDTRAVAGRTTPVLHPPGTVGAAASTGTLAGTWQTKQVLALYTTRAALGGWAYLDGVGWRGLATTNDSAQTALAMIAAAARTSGASVTARDEADGQLHEIYLF